MKKLFIILFLIFYMVLPNRPISAKGGIGLMVGQPSGITVRFDRFPVFTVGYSFLYGNPWINGSLDYWLINNPIEGQFRWYLGVGANAGIYLSSADPFKIGARIPIGIQWIPADLIEVFLEAAPGARLFPTIDFDLQVGLGIRFMIFK